MIEIPGSMALFIEEAISVAGQTLGDWMCITLPDTECFLLTFHLFCSVNTSIQVAKQSLKEEDVWLSKSSDISTTEPLCIYAIGVAKKSLLVFHQLSQKTWMKFLANPILYCVTKPSEQQSKRCFIFILISWGFILKRKQWFLWDFSVSIYFIEKCSW